MKKTPVDFTGRIRVTANVHDLDLDRYFIEVEFRHIDGRTATTTLPRGIIKSGNDALKELLDRGAVLPTGSGAGNELAAVLRAIPERVYRITGKTGWRGTSFVLPDVTIGPDPDTLLHASRKSATTLAPATNGSLEGWRDGLRDSCRASSYLTFGIAVAFAGPLLHLVRQGEGAAFCLIGESSTGKTLTELAGQSVNQQASRESLLTHDTTDRAIEEHCAGHNDLMLVIDEIARMPGSQADREKRLRELAHKIAGGGGSRRSAKARQDADLADLRWRLMSLWSGESALGTRLRGESVRLMEIPVPGRDKNGIFDRLEAAKLSRTELARRAESAVTENFGHPMRAFIRQLVSNPKIHAARATELMEKFLKKIDVGSDPWTLRFASKFAVVYAAARLAAELQVAPWSANHPFKCVARLYKRAHELVATPEEALQDLLRHLAKNGSAMDRFPKVGKGDSLPKHLRSVAWGVRGETRDGTPFLGIHSDRFDDLVHPRHHAVPVRSLLAEGGYTVPGKEGLHVRQIKVQGFGSTEKPYFVCVRLDRLPE
jgi:putative DNA primase/helicase